MTGAVVSVEVFWSVIEEIIVTLRKLRSHKRERKLTVIHEKVLLFVSANKGLYVAFM